VYFHDFLSHRNQYPDVNTTGSDVTCRHAHSPAWATWNALRFG